MTRLIPILAILALSGVVGASRMPQDQRSHVRPTGTTYRVLATREGLSGHLTASGRVIRRGMVFVALPSRSALGRRVIVTYRGRFIVAPVLDVGPFQTRNQYWRTGRLPRRAGIDLSDALYARLGLSRRAGHGIVTWKFR